MGYVKGVLLQGCLSSVISLVLSSLMLLMIICQPQHPQDVSRVAVAAILGTMMGIMVNASLTLFEHWEREREDLERQEELKTPDQISQAWV